MKFTEKEKKDIVALAKELYVARNINSALTSATLNYSSTHWTRCVYAAKEIVKSIRHMIFED